MWIRRDRNILKREKQIEELELTESDLEYGRTVFQRIARQIPSRTASEVAAMRERAERDREARERSDELRLRRLAKQER